ncbi:MAG: class I SAM-dependent methyltransferase [Ferruginibacter sp.]
MIHIPTHIVPFQFNEQTIACYVPIELEVETWYQQQLLLNAEMPFPYWAKLWPSAIALCTYLTEHSILIKDKSVLELAAGIGLPGLIASQYARTVTISDYIPEAVTVINTSINYNQLNNVTTALIDWNHLPETLQPDVILMSDVNYDPKSFDALYLIFEQFIKKGKTIILSTPQRLWSKPFLIRLAPWFQHQQEIAVEQQGQTIYTTVWVLKK